MRTLHKLQLGAQTLLLGQNQRSPMVQWLLPKLLPIVLHTPIMPSIQRRIFFGAPLPPIDPAFTFAA